MSKGLGKQHLAQTLVCDAGLQVLKLLGEASDPAEPSLCSSHPCSIKNLLCFCSHLHSGD